MAEEKTPQERIVEDTPRMGLDDTFTFRCGKDLPCFTECCKDVSIILTPYDVLRLRRGLQMSSGDFLKQYTLSTVSRERKIPVILLKMDPDTKRCLLVTDDGCSVYENRPWACRMYPLGSAQPENPNPENRSFYFLLKEDLCKGHGEGREFRVLEWLQDQGIEHYEMMAESFKNLMLHPFWSSGKELTRDQLDMFYMGCYDLDRFRRFVFESRFLDCFEVDEMRADVMKKSDEDLLDFAMQWLAFSLFKEKTMKIRPEVMAERQKAMEKTESGSVNPRRDADPTDHDAGGDP